MKSKDLIKKICLKPIINKKNHQINFSLPKRDLPKSIRDNLSNLKSIKITTEDLIW